MQDISGQGPQRFILRVLGVLPLRTAYDPLAGRLALGFGPERI